MPDKLIWVPSASGELTARDAFHFLRPRLPQTNWGKLIWSKYIIPRISIHSWKVLRGKVLSEDVLQRRGFFLASRCVLCGLEGESLLHIFFSCSYAYSLWGCWVSWFELGVMPSTIMDLLFYGLNGRSQQLRELWLLCFTTTLWFIWKARNIMKHDGRFIGVDALHRLILGHIQAASRLATDCMFNSLEELRVLKNYNISCRPRRAPRIIEVNWHPPILGWVKINTDGAWQRASGRAGYGGIFRDFRGSFLDAFASNLDIPSSVEAEVTSKMRCLVFKRLKCGVTQELASCDPGDE